MISEINELALGIDLGPVNSQLTFYNRQNSGPRTVSVVPGEENYQIATPAELFSLMEQRLEEGVALLADFSLSAWSFWPPPESRILSWLW